MMQSEGRGRQVQSSLPALPDTHRPTLIAATSPLCACLCSCLQRTCLRVCGQQGGLQLRLGVVHAAQPGLVP